MKTHHSPRAAQACPPLPRWPRGTAALPCAALALALALAGCAQFSADGGFDTVAPLVQQRTGQSPALLREPAQADAARERVAELLAQPLSAEAAMQIALLNDPALQARYAALGIAEAEFVRAGRLAGPTLGLGRLAGGGAVELDRSLVFDLLGLLAMPSRRQAARQRFEQAQLDAALATVQAAAQAREAFFEAVAAQQLLAYAGQVQETAELADTLAQRMAEAGHFNRLARLREQVFRAQAAARLEATRHRALASRERLARALGLADGPDALRLPDRLPALPDAPLAPADAEQAALARRLDLRAARLAVDERAQSLGLTRATRLVDGLHAGVQDQRSTGEPRREGATLELTLPLFDGGSTRVASDEAAWREARQRLAALEVQARSQVREAHSAYRSAWALARSHRDELLPLRRQVGEETLLRYNGMLASVFDLLADAQGQVDAVVASVEALREHWIADSRLQTVIGAGPPGAGSSAPFATTLPTAPAAAAAH